MTTLSDLLATLDSYSNGADAYCQASQAAAQAIRDLASDFDEYADHGLDSRGVACPRGVPRTETLRSPSRPCTCGLDGARARWKLPAKGVGYIVTADLDIPEPRTVQASGVERQGEKT